jgi:uncharacterized protein (TIGR04255 family)
MAVYFPPQTDVQLDNSPLIEVICQVRFPVILRIASEEPSEFQDQIRAEFPLVELEHGFLFRVPGPGAKGSPTVEPQSRVYRFRTADEQTAISLGPDFYALSTKAYGNWGEFARLLNLTHSAIQRVYKPAYAVRLGLRYVNRLSPANTECANVAEMFELLRPELVQQSRNDAWSDPLEMRSRLVLADGDAKLTLGTGYGEEHGEPFFVLDLDYFEEGRLELSGLLDRCVRYNDVLYRAFRWCIRDEKLGVFHPKLKELSK